MTAAAAVLDTPVVALEPTATVPDTVAVPAPRTPRAERVTSLGPRRAAAGKPVGPFDSVRAGDAARAGTLPDRLLAPGTAVALIRPTLIPESEFRERIGRVSDYEYHSPYQTGFPVVWADSGQTVILSRNEVRALA